MGSELKDLTHFDDSQNIPPQVGTTVRFKDASDEQREWPCLPSITCTLRQRDLTAGFGVKSSVHCAGMKNVKTLRVVETKLKIKVRWQDGSESEEEPLGLVPYQNIDE